MKLGLGKLGQLLFFLYFGYILQRMKLKSKINSLLIFVTIVALALLASACRHQIPEESLPTQMSANCAMLNPTLSNDSLCSVEIETGKMTILVSDGVQYFYEPSLNNKGQIVFTCSVNPSFDICSASLDSQSYFRLTEDSSHNSLPQINNKGEIVFNCTPYHDIELSALCMIDFDGSDKQPIEVDDYQASYPLINNQSRIIFTCSRIKALTPEIGLCLIKSDGTGFRQIVTSDSFTIPISFNDRGQFAYYCLIDPISSDEQHLELFSLMNHDICFMDQKGNLIGNLDSDELNFARINMNEADQVVMLCSLEIQVANQEYFDVCSLNLKDMLLNRIVDGLYIKSSPIIQNDGTIYFICREERTAETTYMCKINFDGSNLQKTLIE